MQDESIKIFSKKIYAISFFFILITTLIATYTQNYLVLEYKWYISLICACFFTILLIKNRNENHSSETPIVYYETVGIANWISLTRAFLICLLGGFLFCQDVLWTISFTYSLIVFLDVLDGYMARKTGRCTVFGANIDNECDALGILIATLVAIGQQRVPFFYILVGLLRYLFVVHLFIRKKQHLQNFDLPPSSYRRFIAGIHMVFLAVALSPLFSQVIIYKVSYILSFPFCLVFARDWLVVIAVLDAQTSLYLKLRWFVKCIIFYIVPLLAFLGLFCLVYLANNMLLYLCFFIAMICVFLYFKNTYLRVSSILFVLLYCFILMLSQNTVFYEQIIMCLSILLVTIGNNIR